MRNIRNYIADESGATAIEYGLIAALLSLAMITAAGTMGNSINEFFIDVGDAMNSVEVE